MRGSVWVRIEGYITRKDGQIMTSSIESVYGYGAVTDLNSEYQRQSAFERALSKVLVTYRQHQNLVSDAEVNYHLLDDGIQYTQSDTGKRLYWKQTDISPSKKRESHKKVIGKLIIIRPEDVERQYEERKVDIIPRRHKELSRKAYLQATSNLKKPRGKLSRPP